MTAPTGLGLAPGDFWSNPLGTRDTAVQELIDAEFVGLALDAPAVVPYEARGTLPAVILHGEALPAGDEILFNNMAIVVAAEVDGGAVHVGTFLQPLVLDEPIGPPATPSSEGFAHGLHTTDLRKRLDLPWQAAELVVTVLVRDRVSNRVRVSLRPTYADEAVRALIAERRAALPAPAVRPWPARPTPYYRPTQLTPPVPVACGIALAPRRAVVLGDEGGALVSGSFRLPLARRFFGRPQRGDLIAATGDYTAVVPITLVVTGTAYPGPFVLRMVVPTFDALPDGAATAEVTGHFSVDLSALAVVPYESQTCFVYAFAGEHLAGPSLMGVVVPSDLPRSTL